MNSQFNFNKILSNNNYSMNIDKGNQALGGSNMVVTGNIAVSSNNSDYKLKNFSYTNFYAKSDADGTLWIIIGTDSGFEARTSIYYTYFKCIFH